MNTRYIEQNFKYEVQKINILYTKQKHIIKDMHTHINKNIDMIKVQWQNHS